MQETMSLGVGRLVLHLPHSQSLKDKRQAVTGLLKQVRREFGVAAAEVGDGDRWQRAEVGVACVSNDPRHADEIIAKVITFIENHAGEAVLGSVKTEILRI